MKILVTGAAGRLGRVVCEYLHQAGHELRGTDVAPWPESPVPFTLADLRDYAAVAPLVEGCEAVVQLGNHPGLRSCPDARQLYLDNTAMNANVFAAAVAAGVPRLVYASSIQVIAGHRQGAAAAAWPSSLPYLPLDVDTPPNPGNLYALSKLAGEHLLRCYAGPRPALAATAIRFPLLTTPELRQRLPLCWPPGNGLEHHLHWDEGLAWLPFADAAALIGAVLSRPAPGYRLLLAAAATPWAPAPLAEIVARLYPGVPLRRPLGQLTGLVDLASLARDYGWQPGV